MNYGCDVCVDVSMCHCVIDELILIIIISVYCTMLL